MNRLNERNEATSMGKNSKDRIEMLNKFMDLLLEHYRK
jgi:hypothetical protein